MATSLTEQRARRKYVKELYELNQLVKNVYSSYCILEGGTIFGVCIKDKFKHSYFHTELVETHPELVDTVIHSEMLYDAFRDKRKPEEIIITGDGMVTLVDENSNTFVVGRKIKDLKNAGESATKIVAELNSVVSEKTDSIEFMLDEINNLVSYQMIYPKFLNSDKYTMILSISEFPNLKKMGNLRAYMKDYKNEDFFDVVFIIYSAKGERFNVLRRFVKMEG